MAFGVVAVVSSDENLLDYAEIANVAIVVLIRVEFLILHHHAELVDMETEGLRHL